MKLTFGLSYLHTWQTLQPTFPHILPRQLYEAPANEIPPRSLSFPGSRRRASLRVSVAIEALSN